MKKFRIGIQFKLCLITISFMAIVSLGCILLFQHQFNNSSIEDYSNEGLNVLKTVSVNLDADKYAELAHLRNVNDPYYEELRQYFSKVKESTGLAYLYTESFEDDGKTTIYVVDGNDPQSDDFSSLGSKVNGTEEVDTPEMLKALKEGTIGYSQPEITKEWGELLSCYYPIKTSDGKIVGVLSCDIKAGDIQKRKQDTIYEPLKYLIPTFVLAVLLLALILKFMITRNVIALKKHMDDLAKGNFTVEVSPALLKRNDEIGAMAQALNSMQHSVRNIVRAVIEEAEQLKSSADYTVDEVHVLDAGIQNISEATQYLSQSMEETAASMEEMNASSIEIGSVVETIAQRAKEGAAVASEINQRAAILVENAVESKQNTSTLKDGISQKLSASIEHSHSVNKINKLADAILDITAQTHLLSLNAAIESARAGEAGKGFGVVSDEIAKLAHASKEIANEILQITREVVGSVDELSDNSQKVMAFIDTEFVKDYDMIERSGQQYSEDAGFVDRMTLEFSATSEQLMTSVQESLRAIEEISAATAQGAENTQAIAEKTALIQNKSDRVKEMAVGIKEASKKLAEAVAVFKI